MGFFDETVIKAKDIFDSASKKTSEIVSNQKLKIKISQLESEIGKDYKKIGELYYLSQKKDIAINDSVNDIIAEIDLKMDEIKQLRIELDNMKAYVVCKECGTRNPENASFCSSCGAKLN